MSNDQPRYGERAPAGPNGEQGEAQQKPQADPRYGLIIAVTFLTLPATGLVTVLTALGIHLVLKI